VSGAREQKQLERIINFMNILIYLYSEIYILKKPHRQEIKKKLVMLVDIAKRRNKVAEIANHQREINAIKQMAKLDKKRLGFTPEEGQNQWSRSCQNSGNDKKRRPTQTLQKNISELIKKGYVLNKKTGEYERHALYKKKGSKRGETIIKAIKMTDQDEQGNTNEIFYTCEPEENGEHMFIGFLTRSNNPFGECMPCCYKKNKMISKKKETIDFYKRCMKETPNKKDEMQKNIIIGEILYILEGTNKIQENRIGYLPSFIDWFTNVQFKKERTAKNHYLLKTDGYYFKYGIKQENYSFLNTLELILKISIIEIKKIIIDFLKKDVNQNYYYSLNDGDIVSEFLINDFINFISENENISYYYFKDLLKIPGLFTKNGIYPFILNKVTTITKNGNDRDKLNDDYFIDIDKSMVNDFNFHLKQIDEMDVLFMMKENKFYFPIVQIIKNDSSTKNIEIIKLFNKNNSNDNLIVELKKYFTRTIEDIQIDHITTHLSAKTTIQILEELSKTNKEYKIQYQVIDQRFKCKYLITMNNLCIPVMPSGIYIGIPIICFNNNAKIQDCFRKINFKTMSETNDDLEKLYKISNKKLNIKPIGLFYDTIDEKNMVNVVGIITSNNDLVPIIPISIYEDELKKSKIQYKNRPLYYELDEKLVNYNKINFQVIDARIKNVNLDKYKNEAYQLFKFELSNLINIKEYEQYKKDLKTYIIQKNSSKIQDLILNICINKLDNKIISKNTVGPELVKIIQDIPNLDYYKINNQRVVCDNLNENQCQPNSHPHCTLHDGKCKFALTQEYLFEFIKKISIDVIEHELTALEILREKKNFISDIVNFDNFTEKSGQTIIKNSNANLLKILTDMFGKEHVPKIGKRYSERKTEIDLKILQIKNPLKDIKYAYSQSVIPFNYSILRAYCNGYYWFKHLFYTIEAKNLGFYCDMQNEIINIFRSLIIDWFNIPDNVELLENLDDESKQILKNKILYTNNRTNKHLLINNYIIELMERTTETNFGLLELFILNNIHDIPICIMLNNIPTYYLDKQIIKISDSTKNYKKYQNSNVICINAEIHSGSNYPYAVDIIYYKKNDT
jgi:hypothetical protein